MRIFYDAHNAVSTWTSLFLFMTEFGVQAQGVPPSWKLLHQEWDKHEKEGVKDRARKAKEEVTTSIKGHDFFQNLFFSSVFCHSLPLSFFCIAMCVHYLGEGKEAVWTERGISSHACSSTPPRVAGRGREEWHGHEWENILAFSMGLLVRSLINRKWQRRHTTTEWKWNKG